MKTDHKNAYSSDRGLSSLFPFFDLIDATPPEYPGHFAFCIPSDAAYLQWPAYPISARPESGRAAAGRGMTLQSCRNSGVGEAIELASACAWGDEPTVCASMQELENTAIQVTQLLGFSSAQIQDRDRWNTSQFGKTDWRPAPLASNRQIDWIQVQDTFSGRTAYLPADFVFIGRDDAKHADPIAIATTSGCAAGDSPRTAQTRALKELLERDAIGRWWYGARSRNTYPLRLLARHKHLYQFLEKRDRQTVLIDISTDLCRHIVVAVSMAHGNGAVAMGFAARQDLEEAATHATIELLQTEIGLLQRNEQDDPIAAHWAEEVPGPEHEFIKAAFAETPNNNAPTDGFDIVKCMDRIERANLQLYFIDLTRACFGIPVVRAVCPGLCNDKPRWGNPRLLDVDSSDRLPITAGFEAHAPPNTTPLLV